MTDPPPSRSGQTNSRQELRRITAFFCDIIGSTELGTKLDIEDYCALLDAFQSLCQREIDAAGGWIAQIQGDGVLAYFGYPTIFEDSARRAVQAGLAIVNELGSRKFLLPSQSEQQLSARVSAHTGSVITLEGDQHTSQLPEGVTINIAKKVQQFASENCMVVTADTADLVRQYFQLGESKIINIDCGVNEIEVFEVKNTQPVLRASYHQFGNNNPPLVARKAELQLLMERWEMAQHGLGQYVLLVGEAGIGKSRLIHELKQKIGIPDDAWQELRCTPDTSNSAFFPFREFLVSQLSCFHVVEDESLGSRIDDHLQELGLMSEPNALALRSLLGAAFGNAEQNTLPPAVVRRRIKEFLIQYFLTYSKLKALVLVFEDLHWTDASTLEIIQILATRCRCSSVLIVCAQRPEERDQLLLRSEVTTLSLGPLQPVHVGEMVRNMGIADTISERERENVHELTGGNPLFVEQYFSNIVSVEGEPIRNFSNLVTKFGTVASRDQIPPTLHETIAYRLERLSDAKRVAQCASVLGQFIQLSILQRMVGIDEAEFDTLVDILVRSSILTYTSELLTPKLSFRHALIREAAYDMLLGSQKRDLHRRAAELLTEEKPNNDLIPDEVIAHHFGLAQAPVKAIFHWREAAAQASKRFANDEALSHLREALVQVSALPSEDADRTEIEIREHLAVHLEAMRGWAAEETERNLKRLLELQASVSDEFGVFGVYHALCSMHGIRGEISKGLSYAKEMRTIASRTDDVALRVLSLRVVGIFHFLIAEFQSSIQLFEEMAEIYTEDIRARVSLYYPANPVAVGFAFSAFALGLIGETRRSLEALERSRRAISSEKDEFTMAYVEGFAASAYLALSRNDDAVICAQKCLSLSEENSFDYWISWAKITLGYGRLIGNVEDPESLGLLRQGVEQYSSTGSRQLLPYAMGLYADALIKTGADQGALSVINDLEQERCINEVSSFDKMNEKLFNWRKTKAFNVVS